MIRWRGDERRLRGPPDDRSTDTPAVERLSRRRFYDLDVRTHRTGWPEPEHRSPERAETLAVPDRAPPPARPARLLGGRGRLRRDRRGGRACGGTLTWLLATYAVRPGLQGRGVGRQLLDAALPYGRGCLRGHARRLRGPGGRAALPARPGSRCTRRCCCGARVAPRGAAGRRAGPRGLRRRHRPDGLGRPAGARQPPTASTTRSWPGCTGWWSPTGSTGSGLRLRPAGRRRLPAGRDQPAHRDATCSGRPWPPPPPTSRSPSTTSRPRTSGPSTSGWPPDGAADPRLPRAARHEAADALPAQRPLPVSRSAVTRMSAVTTTSTCPLLPLGRGTDLRSERGRRLPRVAAAASDPDLVARARAAKEALGDRVFVLGPPLPARRGHPVRRRHRRLLQARARRRGPAGGGVHRLLRRALHGRVGRHPHRARAAGDPARPRGRLLDGRHGRARRRSRTPGTPWPTPGSPTSVVPITYMNSSADIKAFCGRNGGAVCTSSNAQVALEWAFDQQPGRQGALPARPAPRPQHRRAADGHVARRLRGVEPAQAQRRAHRRAAARRPDDPVEGPLLGARPVHRPSASTTLRERIPGVQVLVHPECTHEVVHEGRPGRLDRVHHQDRRGGPGRARPGPSAPSSTSSSGSRTPTPTRTSRSSTRRSATARR